MTEPALGMAMARWSWLSLYDRASNVSRSAAVMSPTAFATRQSRMLPSASRAVTTVSTGGHPSSIIITSNLPFDEWTEVFGSERLTGATLDRLTHHVHILEMNGESYRLRESRKAKS